MDRRPQPLNYCPRPAVRVHNLGSLDSSNGSNLQDYSPQQQTKMSTAHEKASILSLQETTQNEDTQEYLQNKHLSFHIPLGSLKTYNSRKEKRNCLGQRAHPSSTFKYNSTHTHTHTHTHTQNDGQIPCISFYNGLCIHCPLEKCPICAHLSTESRPALRLFQPRLPLTSLRCPLHTTSSNDTSPFQAQL